MQSKSETKHSEPSRKALLGGWVAIGLVIIAIGFLIPDTALANGGTLVYSGDSGNFNVNIVMSPSPPVPTVPTHFTLVLTRKASDQPVPTATVTVEPEMLAMAMPEVSGQRFIQNPNRPNEYHVDIPTTMEGLWRFNFKVVDPQLGVTSFKVDSKIEKPDAPWIIIVAILVGLPVLSAITWFFLFRSRNDDDEDDNDEDGQEKGDKSRSGEDRGSGQPEVKLGT